MSDSQPEKVPEWRSVGENLVRHRAGTIYLRAKVAGKKGPIRVSLETSDLRIAKILRDERLEALRAAATKAVVTGRVIQTLGDAVDLVEARVVGQSHTKASSSKYNGELVGVLRQTLPVGLHPKRWDERAAREWWKGIGERFGHTRANATLHLVRKVMAVCVGEGLIRKDPTELLTLIRGKKKVRDMPTRMELRRVIESIASIPKQTSEEASLFVEFLAATGMRPEEARSVRLTNIFPKWIRITGNETGTKNGEERELPISPVLRVILDRLFVLEPKGAIAKRTKRRVMLFSIQDSRASLTSACKRLGLPHLTLYDMRHYFITWAIESGVDIPTIAKWIGHKDGGALLMRTYTHIRDLHSLEKAALLK